MSSTACLAMTEAAGVLIDSHAHIQMKPYATDRSAVLRRAAEAGMTAIVTVGTDVESSRAAIAIAQDLPAVYATAGVHPHDAATLDNPTLAVIAALAEHPTVVAIGEIGLDYFRNGSPRDVQRAAFDRQLELAAALDLPVVVHDRDAHDDTFDRLERWALERRRAGAEGPLGVRHCWSGPLELAAAYQRIGFMISIAGNVTYPSAEEIQSVAAAVSPECLLVETDCPYLAPVPLRGKRNEPANVTHTVQFVAALRGEPADRIAQITAENALRLFRISGAANGSPGGFV